MSPTFATLRSLSADLYPLPDRLRLLPQPPLTARPASGNLNSPNDERPCRSLCQRPPAGVNRGVFAFLPSAHLMGVEYISAEQRPVSVRTGGLSTAGERCFAFFCTRNPIPK